MKEFPLLGMLNIHENLLEALLELQAYADVQAVLSKYDGKAKPFYLDLFKTSNPLTAILLSTFRHQFAKISHYMLHICTAESTGCFR